MPITYSINKPPAYKSLGSFKIPFSLFFFLRIKYSSSYFPLHQAQTCFHLTSQIGMCLILIFHLCSVEETCTVDNRRQTRSYLNYDLCYVFVYSQDTGFQIDSYLGFFWGWWWCLFFFIFLFVCLLWGVF